ncbi:hypothetical protein CspeluHIS016_0203480 [Cutaneotrichosporon spelunceum]|uniref:PWI domain-containing protein n=1 Tax=Cutaneotrichosporon spelunceum TaxID=1672016 RepID=A0AAD3TR27_9TREE|nr:hypothetical protein CspeluHIS016_0203480 [Cutaneotrichosporon spelunceum]
MADRTDARFKDKEAASIKATKFPAHFGERVDLRKVNISVLRPWIAKRLIELMRVEDDVVVEYVYSMLEDKDKPLPDPKKMQVNLVGFMDKYGAAAFMDELWKLLLSAQATVGGVPAEFIEAKKKEIEAARAGNAASGDLDGQMRARADALAERDGGRGGYGRDSGRGWEPRGGRDRGERGYGGGGDRGWEPRRGGWGGGGGGGYGRERDSGWAGRGGQRDDAFAQRYSGYERDSGYGHRDYGRGRDRERSPPRRRSPSPRRREEPPPRSSPRRRSDVPVKREHSPIGRDESGRREREHTPPRRARDDSPPRRARDDTPPRRARDDTPPHRTRDDTPPRHAGNDTRPGRTRDDSRRQRENSTPPRRGGGEDDTPPRGATRNDDTPPARATRKDCTPPGRGRDSSSLGREPEAELAHSRSPEKRAEKKKKEDPLAKSRWA